MGKTISELRDDRAFAIKTAQKMVDDANRDDRDLNDEENKDSEELLQKADRLEAEIKLAEASDAQKQRINGYHDALREPAPRITQPEQPTTNLAEPDKQHTTPARPRYATLTSYKGADALEDAYRDGQWFCAKFLKNRAAELWCERNGVYVQLAMEGGTATAGGNLVPRTMNQAIIDNRERFGKFRQNARLVPMGQDTMAVPVVSSGTTSTTTAESATIAESDPVWVQAMLTARKEGILTRISTELAEDAVINIADWLARDFGRAFANKEDTMGFVGAGTAAHGHTIGVATMFDNDNDLAGAVEAASGVDSLSEITTTDLTTLMGTLPEYALLGAKWYCSNLTKSLVFDRLAAVAGGNTIDTLAGQLRNAYLGHEIVVSQVLFADATLTNGNNLTMLMFGDLEMAALLGERRGIEVATSTERYFAEDQIGVRATERIAITINDVGTATAAGPIVSLIGQT